MKQKRSCRNQKHREDLICSDGQGPVWLLNTVAQMHQPTQELLSGSESRKETILFLLCLYCILYYYCQRHAANPGDIFKYIWFNTIFSYPPWRVCGTLTEVWGPHISVDRALETELKPSTLVPFQNPVLELSLFRIFLLVNMGQQHLHSIENTLQSTGNYMFMSHTWITKSIFMYMPRTGFYF